MTARRILLYAIAGAPLGAIWPIPAYCQDNRQAAMDLLERGAAAFAAGDTIAATRLWTEAIRLSRLAGAPALEAEALARRGEAYRVEGDLRQAAEDMTAALVKARAVGEELLAAAATGALGSLAFMSRRTAVAEPLLLENEADAHRLGDAALAGAAGNDLGNLYAATERPDQAARAYAEAIRQAEAAGDGVLAASVETNAARLALNRGDLAQAMILLRGATGRLKRMGSSYPAGLALAAAGAAGFAAKGQLPAELMSTCQQAFEAAVAAADRLGNPALGSLALGGLGRLNERSGRLSTASQFTQQALFRAHQASAPDIAFRWDWQQARIERALGRDDAALTGFRRAAATLQTVRQDIPI